MGWSGKSNVGAEQRQQEAERTARVAQGNSAIDEAFSGFDDNFYDQRAKDYEAYAVPQVTQQYDRTKKNLTYSLARSGLLNSGVQVEKNASLDQENAAAARQIGDTAQGQANELRQTIEGQRSALVAQNQASGDPGSAGSLALRTAQAYQKPTSFAPVGQFFENWTRNYLANKTAQDYNAANEAMFGWGNAPQRVVNG